MSLLQPFPRPVGDIGLGAFSAEEPVVTMEDLIQSDVRVTWDEAVSIVEELCGAARGMVMRPIPGASDVILNANGTVAIRQAAAGVPDPVEAARRLHELLGGSAAPAALRLFVSQAVSSGSYHSLAEFDDALAYFAKPGRQERVKAVYQRASEQLKLKPRAAVEQVQPDAVAAPPPSHGAPSGRYHWWRQAAVIAVTAAALAATIVVGLGLYAWPLGFPTPSAAPEAQAPVAAPGGDTAPGDPAAAMTTDGQPAPRTAAALDAARIPLTGSAAAIRYTRRDSGESQRGSREPAAAAGGLPPTYLAPAPAERPRTETAPSQQPPQQADALAPAASTPRVSVPFASAPATEPSSTIYSVSDATVQPATLTKPQILPPAFGGASGQLIRMELIISPAGTVERARFLEAPQRMADMMILSSAKTWQFTPAVKDGQPVRYRTVMSWVGAP